ncbi:nuclear transport factor 2 family protein [Thalassotalea ganghwensis]
METVINQPHDEHQVQASHNDPQGQPVWLKRFVEAYQQLGVKDFTSLERVYHDEIVFIDPLHRLVGKAVLLDYFKGLYTHLVSCQFSIDSVFVSDDQAAVYWRMTYQHPKLNRGQPVEVSGHSHLKGNGEQVYYHRDYLDAGAMLYEHIPLLGSLVKLVKKRAVA